MTTALPPSTDFTGAGVTEAAFKTALAAQRTFLADLLGTTGAPDAALIALGLTAALLLKADLASPVFTGLPELPSIKFPATAVQNTDPNVLDDYQEQSSYAVTATPGAGTFSDATFNAVWVRVGRLCTIHLNGTVALIGTGTGALILQLPFAAATSSVAAGRLGSGAASAVVGSVAAAASTLSCANPDGTSFLTNGVVAYLSMSYMVQEGS